MRSRVLVLFVALTAFLVPASHGFMEFIGPDDGMPVSGAFPEALKRLVRTDTRVLGVVGPIVDWRISYAGDTAELNGFLKVYTKVPDTRLKVVLHPGRGTCRYRTPVFGPDGELTGEELHVFDVDWKLHIGESPEIRDDKDEFEGKKFLTTLDIWLGGQIDLRKLDVPLSLPVASSGELEGFVDGHEKERKQQGDGRR